MSKVLVDRDLLDSAATWLEVHAPGGGCVEGSVAEDLRAILEQPAEAEGPVEMGSDAWMALHLLDRLDVSADEEPRVQQVEEIVRRMGAALSAVTAERDGLAAARMAYANEFAPDENGDPDVGNVHANIRALKTERDQLRAEVETLRKVIRAALYYVPEHKHDLRELISAAMAAKEA